ncbi:tetratricopeptide repeat protein [Rhodospirillum rubrum]|uniref:TPR repeat n=1 Tax=Rhodospirillum rubrum (strain ATCC 11170 / ATH 1.1.1 / DSM 467 / LMG 4362 / NCIMB 8255 / S1) TaxID=269796 RepID=Q2RQ77_RHORT|nr:tetratricopeptide repeat protein [Rhodospirillum rubrum]ABC23718.1 TPR repeat [Rhodospirillum rubrum ATCC 11170]AEO49457.1 TPR repeat-containing protein [Rhodospirillum rubrum F11]MBK5955394.1 hypothetical protein [Rhodospirillum rubrum]QXG79674.1 tetratricopeptide repeat protein [Rhodospirillum rubrum]HAP98924.1 tetratricopeptide repeat protein [Rhodospirillum rubrum]
MGRAVGAEVEDLAARGRRLAEDGRLDEAREAFAAALAAAPGRVDLLTNLGAIALRLGEPAQAIDLFDRALAQTPSDADARYNRGLARLLAGDRRGGFEDYRARWRAFGLTPPYDALPPWDGAADGPGPLLLHTEQGLGDALHFVRYCPDAAARGLKVVLACQPALGALLAGAPGIDRLIPLGAPPPPGARALALMDLPGLLELGEEGHRVPYLGAEGRRVDAWAARLAAIAPRDMRIGVAWRGSPTHGLDRERSFSPALFGPLAALPGVRLIALHPDATPAEAGPAILCPEPDADWRRDAFLGTAAMMGALDLVITVDTVFAHLAGALGRPAWVLLPRVPDWRWGLSGETTPWYPTLRLLRQKEAGDWPGVVAEAARRLASRLARKGRR